MENEFGRTILFHKKHLKNYIWIVHYLIKMESKVMVEVVCTQDTLRVKRLFLDEIKTIKNQLAEQGIKKLKALGSRGGHVEATVARRSLVSTVVAFLKPLLYFAYTRSSRIESRI